MRTLRATGIAITFLLSSFLVFIPLQWMAIRFDWKLNEQIPIGYARFLCRLMGVRVETFGRPVRDRGVFLAANHTSYLDTVVLAAVIPVAFVAKSDVAGWPFFGTVAKLVGTVFVERERRSRTG